MASVSVVAATDFRANLAPAQNSVPEGDDPFSLLLNSVADAKAVAQRPDAPRVAERRNDAPAKPPKPETDPDRQARRQARDTSKSAAKPQAEAQPQPPVKPKSGQENDETEANAVEPAGAEALLALASTDPQLPAGETAPALTDANAAAEAATMPVVAVDPEVPATIPATPANAAAAASAAAQTAQAGQNAAAAKVQFDAATAPAQAEAEAALPKISAETLSSLIKPMQAVSSADAPPQAQPTMPAAHANAAQTPAPLEMLNAAISKHVELALGADADEAATEAPKPAISSNAVAPNFAITMRAAAPLAAPTPTTGEALRAVPFDQLAVEIATRANKGDRRFDIRLDPPELGRIDVRLEIDGKGNTTAKLIVERAETLDLLQRDARGLEKALQNAGLKTDAGGLEFSLQQDAQAQQGHGGRAAEPNGRHDPLQSETEILTEIPVGNASLAAQLRGGVDIRI